MAFGKITALDKDAVTILQVLLKRSGRTATEACTETRHRGAVSYPGLVFDTDHSQGVEELRNEIVLFVIQRRAAE